MWREIEHPITSSIRVEPQKAQKRDFSLKKNGLSSSSFNRSGEPYRPWYWDGGHPGEAWHLYNRAPARCFGLSRTVFFVPLPARSSMRVCLVLLASSLSILPLLACRSSRWTRLQKLTYSDLVIFLALHRALALLNFLLVASFRCCVRRWLVAVFWDRPSEVLCCVSLGLFLGGLCLTNTCVC